jgi:hypothetical protein
LAASALRYLGGGGQTPEDPLVAQKNVVIRSHNLDGEMQCVDIFQRPDGTYGFEEYRRDPEDGRGWFAIGHYSSRSFDREADAVLNAKASISWLGAVAERSVVERGS